MEAREKEYLDGLFEKARKAQIEMEFFSQEQTDKLVKAIGKAIYDNREILSREAIEETGLGVYEGKVAKHAAITMSHWEYLKDKKSVGLIEEDPANGIYLRKGSRYCCLPYTYNKPYNYSNRKFNVRC